MNLNIAGRKAIICASSKGLGFASAMRLAEAGCEVFINGRDAVTLESAAVEIRAKTGAKVTPVVADLNTSEGRVALLKACPNPDILVNNNGGPPLKNFRELTHEAMVEGVEANMITPIQLIQTVIDGMIARKWGRIINITSGSVKMPIVGLDLSSGARAGLTAFLAGVARNVAEHNVTINHLLPGPFDTDRLKGANKRAAEMSGKTVEEAENARKSSIPAKRFGTPDEFGAACAFLASDHAGFITGQSLLLDGGLFNSAF
jgi:3-oxoacyl-[acyl-carrier protein] reductase